MPSPGKGARYRHGDLRAALVRTAIEVIGERGVRGFSLAEASRRLGIAVSAPYAHFADRDDRDRQYGSSRFMAPEEFRRGATINERSTVFNLGRAAFVLLGGAVRGEQDRHLWHANDALYSGCLDGNLP